MPRPKTRGECVDGPRPCLHIRCRHHMGIDVKTATGRVKEYAGWMDRETCALDMADRGGMTLDQIGDVMGVNRARVFQIEKKSLNNLRKFCANNDITPKSMDIDRLDDLRSARASCLDKYGEEKTWGYCELFDALNELEKDRPETRFCEGGNR